MKTITAKVSSEQIESTFEEDLLTDVYIDILAEVDIYDVIEAFEVQPALVNAVKKLLQPGERHAKSKIQDLEEAVNCVKRVIEIETIKENLSNLT